MSNKRLIIIGGVAGGASAAARARRLCEDCEIIMFERDPHVSFANRGLPYFVGGEIAEQDSLLVQTPESLKEHARGFISGSINIPLDELRQRLSELPRDREIIAYCQSGQRSYNAVRLLRQRGFNAANLSGGYTTFRHATAATPG